MNSSRKSGSRASTLIVLFLLLGVFIVASAFTQEPALPEAAAEAVEETEPFWLWMLLGRFHPLIVHFPVGLLCVALVLELVDWRTKSAQLRNAITILLWIGAVSAVLAVVFGWMLAANEGYQGTNIEIHRWLGIVTMALSILTLLSLKNGWISAYRYLLIITVLGVSFAGHYGAMVTHGSDYLTEVLPIGGEAGETRNIASNNPNFVLASLKQTDSLTLSQQQDLNLEVRTIFAHACYQCHGSDKAEGELRLNSKEAFFKGGESGPVIVSGNPDESDLIRRIKLPAGHDDVMPSKGKTLSEKEIDVLSFWVERGAPWPDQEKSIYYLAPLAPREPNLPAANAELSKPIDLFVDKYFEENGIEWSAPVDDRTYIRRVYLDVIGLLPHPDSIEVFAASTAPDKRENLVKSLLNRDHDYTQHWLTFWNDLLRNDYTGTGYITNGRFDITGWLYNSLYSNKPYDQFVGELISPDEESEGFIRGIRWRGTINSSQSTEMQAAQNVSQVFMGLNLKCASCHDSFISDWKLDQAYAFANIFSDTTLQVARCDKPTGELAGRAMLFPELGTISTDAPTPERLKELADYITQPKNGRLYRTIVNRIWAQLMGRGIIEPVDVMDNLPWSQDLLDWLATDFTKNGYDIKQLLYNILTSKTYQLPSVSVEEAGDLVANDFQFRGMVRRRMSAEQFADAVSKVFTPLYPDSAIAEKLPPGVIEHTPFVRASMVINDPFLKSLGRPSRETVITNRMSQASLLQALELTNGSKLTDALHRGAAQWHKQYASTDSLVSALYMKALGRPASTEEINFVESAIGPVPSEEAIQDLVWAVLLVPEFQLIY